MKQSKNSLIHKANNLLNMMNGLLFIISKKETLSESGQENIQKVSDLIKDLHQLMIELSLEK